MTLMVSLIAPFYLLPQDNKNEMQSDFLSYFTLLALASALCDANGIVSSTIVFIKSRQLK